MREQREAGRNAGRGRGRDESRDESLVLADLDADMDAWRGEQTTGQEKALLAPVEGTAEGDAAAGAADEGDSAADEGGVAATRPRLP